MNLCDKERISDVKSAVPKEINKLVLMRLPPKLKTAEPQRRLDRYIVGYEINIETQENCLLIICSKRTTRYRIKKTDSRFARSLTNL